ncbi:MAG TPA: ADP-ribose-binding protein [Geobacteraceae bacterium]|nr:ADP-ribose-binding protein [Geobacteraceae bacterium]
MKEFIDNIWNYHGSAIVVITTNGPATRTGKAALGNGCSRQAGRKFPGLAERLGASLAKQGNHVPYLGNDIVSFPVEHSSFENPDLKFIERSTRELVSLVDQMGWDSVVVPRPGCGGGGLSWKKVNPILEKYFDDRFLVIAKQES